MALRISRFGHWRDPIQVAQIDNLGITELYICARPTRDQGEFTEQAHSMYQNLFKALTEHGASPCNVITEKVFFSDVDRQFQQLEKIRRDYYGQCISNGESFPATIFLHQPPCNSGRLCELQVYAIFSEGNEEIKIHTLNGGLGLASGKVVEYRGGRHLYLTNLTGGEGTDSYDFPSQAEDMFTQAETLLRKEGLSFRDVIRTWIYVNNIKQDYADLNRVRTSFYHRHKVTRLPASTGIQGATYPKKRGCAMDLYTLTSEQPVTVEVMHAPTMNEAPEYGSSFSRGLRVIQGDRVTAYISGTASIDNAGNVLYVGDIKGQVDRMLLNLEELLAAYHLTPNDIVNLITYLKEPEFLDTFHKIYARHSFPRDIPNTVATADICRPEWLCEIEAIAVSPLR